MPPSSREESKPLATAAPEVLPNEGSTLERVRSIVSDVATHMDTLDPDMGMRFRDRAGLRDPEPYFEHLFALPPEQQSPRFSAFVAKAYDSMKSNGAWPHPFFPELIRNTRPTILRHAAGSIHRQQLLDPTREPINVQLRGLWNMKSTQICAVADPYGTIGSVLSFTDHQPPRSFDRAAIHQAALQEPQLFYALRSKSPSVHNDIWHECNTRSFGLLELSRAEAVQHCSDAKSDSPSWMHQKLLDIAATHLEHHFPDISCNSGLIGVLEFLGKQKMFTASLLQQQRIADAIVLAGVRLRKDGNRKRVNPEIGRLMATLCSIPGLSDLDARVDASFTLQKIVDGTSGMSKEFAPAMNSPRFAEVRAQLQDLDPQDRDALLAYVSTWSAARLDDELAKLEADCKGFEDRNRSAKYDLAYNLMITEPNLLKTYMLQKYAPNFCGSVPNVIRAALPKEELDGWSALLRARHRQNNYFTGALEWKIKEDAIQSRYSAHHEGSYFLLRGLLESNDPLHQARGKEFLGAMQEHCSIPMVLHALQLLPPREALDRLQPAFMERVKQKLSLAWANDCQQIKHFRRHDAYDSEYANLHAITAPLLQVLYRAAEQMEPDEVTDEMRDAFATSLQSLFTSREGTVNHDDQGAAAVLGPNILTRAMEQGTLRPRRPVPLPNQRRAELEYQVQTMLENTDAMRALSPVWRTQFRVRANTKKALPKVLIGSVLLGVAGGVYYGYQKLDQYIAQRGQSVREQEQREREEADAEKKRRRQKEADSRTLERNRKERVEQRPFDSADALSPHAPDFKEEGEAGTEQRMIRLSEELQGDDRYLILRFYNDEHRQNFKLWRIDYDHPLVDDVDQNLKEGRKRVYAMGRDGTHEVEMEIPGGIPQYDHLPLPLRALTFSEEDDLRFHEIMGREGTPSSRPKRPPSSRPEIFGYQSHGYFTVGVPDRDYVRFSLPNSAHAPAEERTPAEILQRVPQSMRDLVIPKLDFALLQSLAPSLAQAVNEARTMPAYAAAKHLEDAVRGFLQYMPVEDYETRLGEDNMVDPPGRHEYLEMILTLQKGECAQAMRLLKELLAHVGLPSIPFSCFRADGKEVPLIPHTALAVPMIDRNTKNYYLDIFDGTPADLRNPSSRPQDLASASPSPVDASYLQPESVIAEQQDRTKLLIAAAAATAAAGAWALRRRNKRRRGTEEVQKPVASKSNDDRLPHAETFTHRLQAVVSGGRVVKPPYFKTYPRLGTILPQKYQRQMMDVVESQCGPLAAENASGDYRDRLVTTDMQEFLVRVYEAQISVEDGMRRFGGQAWAMVSNIHGLEPGEQQQLTELLALWMHRMSSQHGAVGEWLEHLQDIDVDDLQRPMVVALAKMLSEHPEIQAQLAARGEVRVLKPLLKGKRPFAFPRTPNEATAFVEVLTVEPLEADESEMLPSVS